VKQNTHISYGTYNTIKKRALNREEVNENLLLRQRGQPRASSSTRAAHDAQKRWWPKGPVHGVMRRAPQRGRPHRGRA